MASASRNLATLLAFAVPRPEHALHAFHNPVHLRHRRGGCVELRAKPQAARPVEPQNIPLDIVHEDADMLVISKPPGMTVQLAQGAVENAVAFHLSATSGAQWGTPEWPWNSDTSFEGIVHRLDKGTSGLLVIGKHPTAARALQATFRERKVSKTYLAIGAGMPARRSNSSLEALAAANGKASRSSTATHGGAPSTESEEPRQKLLARAIKACGQDGEQAVAILDQAFVAGEQPSAPCYSAALSVCMRGASRETQEDADTRRLAPRSQRLSDRRASLRDDAAVGERERALSVLDSMHDRRITPNLACFQTAVGLCAREPPLWRSAVELIDRMAACGVGPTGSCVSAAISACGRAGQLDAALRLLDTVLVDTAPEDGACLRAAIRAAERCDDADTARLLSGRLELQASGGPAGGRGSPAGGGGVGETMLVDVPIGKLGKYEMGIMSVASGGREARSLVQPLAFDGMDSLNRIVIETGRTHQIRVHMASVLGCPLAGDRDYGSGWQREATSRRGATSLGTPLGASRPPVQRVMLHAAELELPHPTTGAVLRLTCPPPQDFLARAGAILGLERPTGLNQGSTSEADDAAVAAIGALVTEHGSG